jgi:hypothetical protein
MGISDGLRGARPVAKDILRDPNWFVLGAVSRCTATVVTPDGKEYRFSSFANELSSADVGREVPMTAYRTRSGKPATTFCPSKQLAQNDLGMLLGFFGSAVLAIGGPIAVWPRRRKSLDGAPLNT